MNASVLPTTIVLRTTPKTVSETTSSIRPTSFEIRDITSPVRLWVKKPTDWPSSRSKSCRRRSNMIPWLIEVDRYDWATPTRPATTDAAIATATSSATNEKRGWDDVR